MGAVDDIELVTQLDPELSDGSTIIVARNRNRGKSVIAAFTVSGDRKFPVADLNGGTSLRLFPYSWEVRIPPGQSQFVTRTWMTRWLFHSNGGTRDQYETVNISASLDGARYVADEPTPLPTPDDLINLVAWYTVPNEIPDRQIGRFINIGHVYGIRATLKGPGPGGPSFELPPFWQKLLWAREPVTSYSYSRVSYFPYNVTDLGEPPS